MSRRRILKWFLPLRSHARLQAETDVPLCDCLFVYLSVWRVPPPGLVPSGASLRGGVPVSVSRLQGHIRVRDRKFPHTTFIAHARRRQMRTKSGCWPVTEVCAAAVVLADAQTTGLDAGCHGVRERSLGSGCVSQPVGDHAPEVIQDIRLCLYK